VLDIEDLIPGAEYTLEVSSPGLERKLLKPADYTRFTGSLVKLQTFTPVHGANRHFTGRLTAFDGQNVTLDLAAIKQKGKAKKSASEQTATIALGQHRKSQPGRRDLTGNWQTGPWKTELEHAPHNQIARNSRNE
jgi:ribosome maturation factor RimP